MFAGICITVTCYNRSCISHYVVRVSCFPLFFHFLNIYSLALLLHYPFPTHKIYFWGKVIEIKKKSKLRESIVLQSFTSCSYFPVSHLTVTGTSVAMSRPNLTAGQWEQAEPDPRHGATPAASSASQGTAAILWAACYRLISSEQEGISNYLWRSSYPAASS